MCYKVLIPPFVWRYSPPRKGYFFVRNFYASETRQKNPAGLLRFQRVSYAEVGFWLPFGNDFYREAGFMSTQKVGASGGRGGDTHVYMVETIEPPFSSSGNKKGCDFHHNLLISLVRPKRFELPTF